LVAPLLNRSAIKAEFRIANAAQQEAIYNYQKSILNGYMEVSNEINRLNNIEHALNHKNGQVNALTYSVDASIELFKTGRATYFEVLMNQKNLLDSKLELIELKKRQLNTTVNIYKALGGGWR